MTPASLVNRLDALLSIMASCRGAICTQPYVVMHGPQAGVTTLEQVGGRGTLCVV